MTRPFKICLTLYFLLVFVVLGFVPPPSSDFSKSGRAVSSLIPQAHAFAGYCLDPAWYWPMSPAWYRWDSYTLVGQDTYVQLHAYGDGLTEIERIYWGWGDGTYSVQEDPAGWAHHTWSEACLYAVRYSVEWEDGTFTRCGEYPMSVLNKTNYKDLSFSVEAAQPAPSSATKTIDIRAIAGNNARMASYATHNFYWEAGGATVDTPAEAESNPPTPIVEHDDNPKKKTTDELSYASFCGTEVGPSQQVGCQLDMINPSETFLSITTTAPLVSGGWSKFYMGASTSIDFFWADKASERCNPPSPPIVGAIQGRFFIDEDGDGLRDGGEDTFAVPVANSFWVSPTWTWAQATDAADDLCSGGSHYRKGDLDPATTWKVRAVLPDASGWEFTGASITNLGGNCAAHRGVQSLGDCSGYGDNVCVTGQFNLGAGSTANIWFGVKEACVPVCNAPLCGQDDGCGGVCSSEDNVDDCTAWSDDCDPACEQARSRDCTNPCADPASWTENGFCSDASDVWNCTCNDECYGAFPCPPDDCSLDCGQEVVKSCTNACDAAGYSTDVPDPSRVYNCPTTDDEWECTDWDGECCPTVADCGQGGTRVCTNPCEGCDTPPPAEPAESQTCSDCDCEAPAAPVNLTPGSTNPSNPGRIAYSREESQTAEALSIGLNWGDGDAARVCDTLSWPRTDDYALSIEDNTLGATVAEDQAVDVADNRCGGVSSSGGNDSFWADINHQYEWWTKARNIDCDGGWGGFSDHVYVCRPDCRPLFCGQNDGCGTDEPLTGFNWFGDTIDDDCYWDDNGDPAAPSGLGASLIAGSGYVGTSGVGSPALLDPGGSQEDSTVYLRWSVEEKAQDSEDELQLQLWDVGDPADPDTDPDDFAWGEPGTPGTLILSQRYDYDDLCSAGVCETSLTATYHHYYAWRVAHHNRTCESNNPGDNGEWIDVLTNIGTAKGQIDTLDDENGDGVVNDCANDDLCAGDGERDWSAWADGAFTINNPPRVISISPTCATKAYCWSGHAGSESSPDPKNSENDQSVWPWDGDWLAPQDDAGYCDPARHDCEDIDRQNNPVIYEVVYEDPDGWEDLQRINFTVTEPGGACTPTDAFLGSGYLERGRFAAACELGSLCEETTVGYGAPKSEWEIVDGKIERVVGSATQLRGYFKIRYKPGYWYQVNGGEIKFCLNADDFHTADDETLWAGDPTWTWGVDLRPPVLNIASGEATGGKELTDLFEVDADGDGEDDTWAFEVKVAVADYSFGGAESGLLADADAAKLAEESEPIDGVITLADQVTEPEEKEYSALAWYYNDYDDDGNGEWIRLSDNGGEVFHYEVAPVAFSGAGEVVLTLYVPAENEEEMIGGRYYQRTQWVRVQVRDKAGNSYDSGEFNLELYRGWFQAVNGDVYANYKDPYETYSINVAVPEAAQMADPSFEREHPYFLAADPALTAGGLAVSRKTIYDRDAASERREPGWPWAMENYVYAPLDLGEQAMSDADWDQALGFSWEGLAGSVTEAWDGNSALDPGVVYSYDSVAEGELAGSYNLNEEGVAIVCVDGDLEIGDGSAPGVNATFVSGGGAYASKGLLLLVAGDVLIRRNITAVDAFIISQGEIKFELGEISGPVEIHGSLVARGAFDISRYIFSLYTPVLRTFFNPLYLEANYGISQLLTSQHSWKELE